MAVDAKETKVGVQTTGARRMRVGTNVAVAGALVVGIVAVMQLIAYKASVQWDMTSSGVNSLSDGTMQLLRGLDSNIKLTSLYFETDREDKDQSKYRSTIRDLLELYETTNRGKISATWINPLKDNEKFSALVSRLREHPSFAGGIEPYKERVAAYSGEADGLDTRMRALVAAELQQVNSLGGAMGDKESQQTMAPIEMLLTRWQEELASTRESIDAVTVYDNPQYSVAVNDLKSIYRSFGEAMKSVVGHAKKELARNAELSAASRAYLEGCESRYEDVLGALDAEQESLGKLEPPKIDNLLRQLQPTGNMVLVETDKDAMVVDFASAWPPLNPQMSGGARFEERAFKGEEKVTSAILRATHKEQTAVVFVRYGGAPLFFGGFMPGQPRASYAQLKARIEDANFVVYEWDLKSSDTPPPMDPEPTRMIYVVLKPTPPPQGPMGRPGQDPPFTESHKQKVLDLLGENARALFIAGWYPGPFAAMPATYEWNSYLTDTWGLTVEHTELLVRLTGVGPGQYRPSGPGTLLIVEVESSDHDIVSGPKTRWAFPQCAPLILNENAPEGVELTSLVVQPKREGVWGIKSVQYYETQGREQGYWTRAEDDSEGPFTIAAAASKGDAKIVVVSSQSFAEDSVAFTPEVVLGPQGIQLRSRNPGNAKLMINALHWLNDNTQFMNIGQPIDIATVEVESTTTLRIVQGLSIVVWPALALIGGGCVWWVRRR